MRIIKIFLLLILAQHCIICDLLAEVAVIGKGDYNYSDKIFSSKPDENERKYAIDLAKSNAILAYADTMNESARKLFEQKRSQFLSNPDRYLIRYNIIKDSLNKNARMYSIIIEAYVDDAKIKNDIGDSYGSKDAILAKNNIGVFFVAREVAASTAFDAKVSKVVQNEKAVDATQSSSNKGNSISHSENASNVAVSTTGGSTVRKSDLQEYRIDEVSRGEFGGFLTDIFSAKGMENILDGGFFESIVYMEEDYGKGANIKPMTWRKILKELKDPENEMDYIVVGTVDLSGKEVHAATGQSMVAATVSARIYDIKGKFPKVVVSLRPVTLKGIGTDQNLAKKQALSSCAKDAADEIIDKLRAKCLL